MVVDIPHLWAYEYKIILPHSLIVQLSQTEPSVIMEMIYILFCPIWYTYKVTSATDKLNYRFYLTSISLNLDHQM